MSRRLPFFGGALALALIAVSQSGCVDRRFVFESDPRGAIVYCNGKYVGATPVDQSFTYSGTYRFTFVADGYETLTVDEKIKSPWYLYFPLEFFAESVWPFTIHDVHHISQPLQQRQVVNPEEIRNRGEQLRAVGQALAPPLPVFDQIAPVPPGVPPPGSTVTPVPPPPPPR